jgi:hypothetical protein
VTILDPAVVLVRRSEFEAQLTPAAFTLAKQFMAAVNAKGSGINHRRMINLGPAATLASQERAKVCEIFVCGLLGTPIDLDVYDGADGGYDTVYRGWSFEVKRYGTRKATRGKPRFLREPNDLYINDPPWDYGITVEDDPTDPTVFRIVGLVDRQRWLNQKQYDSRQHPCWYVDRLDPPSVLYTLPEREPARPWPPGPLVPPALSPTEDAVLSVLQKGEQRWRFVIATLPAFDEQAVRKAFGTLVFRKLIRPISKHCYEVLP